MEHIDAFKFSCQRVKATSLASCKCAVAASTFTTGSTSGSGVSQYRILFYWTYHLYTAKCGDNDFTWISCHCDIVTVARKRFLRLLFHSLSPWHLWNSRRATVCVFNCISGLVKAQQAASVFQGEPGSARLLKASHSVIFFSNKTQVSLGDGHLTGCFISLSIHSVSLTISHIHIMSMLLEIESLYCITSFFVRHAFYKWQWIGKKQTKTLYIKGKNNNTETKDQYLPSPSASLLLTGTATFAFTKVSFHHFAC